MDYTAILTAAIVAVPATLAAWAAYQQSKRNSEKADSAKATADATAAKADNLIEKTTEIHTLTNSHLSEMTKTLEVAQEKISGLDKMVATLVENKRIADDALAAAAAKVPPSGPAA